jgi:hypothetical protein
MESSADFIDLYKNKLTKKQKKSRIIRAYICLKKEAEIQIEFLKKIEKEKNIYKNVGFIYFSSTLKESWKNADFAIYLAKNKNKKFTAYPVRVLFENFLRLGYYVKKNKKIQDDIAIRELLRIAKRFYNFTGDEEFKKFFKDFAQLGDYQEIENFKNNDDPFPKISDLTKEILGNDEKKWYHFYQYLSESGHGKLMSIITSEIDENAESFRFLMMMLMICEKLLIITDSFLGIGRKNEINQKIFKSKLIVKKSVK